MENPCPNKAHGYDSETDWSKQLTPNNRCTQNTTNQKQQVAAPQKLGHGNLFLVNPPKVRQNHEIAPPLTHETISSGHKRKRSDHYGR